MKKSELFRLYDFTYATLMFFFIPLFVSSSQENSDLTLNTINDYLAHFVFACFGGIIEVLMLERLSYYKHLDNEQTNEQTNEQLKQNIQKNMKRAAFFFFMGTLLFIKDRLNQIGENTYEVLSNIMISIGIAAILTALISVVYQIIKKIKT